MELPNFKKSADDNLAILKWEKKLSENEEMLVIHYENLSKMVYCYMSDFYTHWGPADFIYLKV